MSKTQPKPAPKPAPRAAASPPARTSAHPAPADKAAAASRREADEEAQDVRERDAAAQRVREADARPASDPRDTSLARKNAAPPPGPERRAPNPRARPRRGRDELPERDLGPLIRVRAFAVGFVDNVRRRVGDVFDVHLAEYTDTWMETVDGSTPEQITGPQAALKTHHDTVMAERAAQRRAAGGTRVAAADDHDPLGAQAFGPRA